MANLQIVTQKELDMWTQKIEQMEQRLERLSTKKEPSELLTTKEAAAYLKVTETTIRNYAERGVITPLRIGERNIRFEREDVKAALKAIQSRRRL